MKSISKSIVSLLLLVIMFSLSACNTNDIISNTKMEFSFSTSTPADSNDEKTIYINNDMDKLELDTELQVDSGDVSVQVINTSNDEVVWNGDYSKDSNFKIELVDLKADNEYLLKVQAIQSKKVKLTITSNDKLVKDKEKPEKYNIEKK